MMALRRSCAAHPAFLLDVFTADNAGRTC